MPESNRPKQPKSKRLRDVPDVVQEVDASEAATAPIPVQGATELDKPVRIFKEYFLKTRRRRILTTIGVIVLLGLLINIVTPNLFGSGSDDSQSTPPVAAAPPTDRAQTPQTTPDDPSQYDYSEYDVPDNEHACLHPDGIPEEVLDQQDEFTEMTALVSVGDSGLMQFVLNPDAPTNNQIEVIFTQDDGNNGFCYYLIGAPYLLEDADVFYERSADNAECRTHVPPQLAYSIATDEYVVTVDCSDGF